MSMTKMTARTMVTKLSSEFGFDLEAAFRSLGLEEKAKMVPMLNGKKVKRAQSAYMFFANKRRPELQAEHPNLKVTELSKMIGAEWKALDAAGKAESEAAAAADKERYSTEMERATMEPEAPKRKRATKKVSFSEDVRSDGGPDLSGGEEESKGSDADVEKPKEKKQPKAKAASMLKVVLPFCGACLPDSACTAVRKNHGLYTQCTMPRLGGETLCKTCKRTMDTKGELPYGLISDRSATVESRGLKVTRYATVMRKLNITKAAATAAATELGWTIPESEFEEEAPKARGRPKKKAPLVPTVESTESDSSGDEGTKKKKAPKKKKAGRPKGKKTAVPAEDGPDLISKLVEQAAEREEAETGSQSEGESKGDSELESEPDEMEDVTEFAHDGVTYYKGADDALYDPETEECVGKWDGEKVVPMAEAHGK